MPAIHFKYKRKKMKRKKINKLYPFLFACIIMTGCLKSKTNYYDDAENTGMAIFSNTGNNVLSCFIDGKPWRTINRFTPGIIIRPTYEVTVTKQQFAGISDSLTIYWSGYYPPDETITGNLSLIMGIAKNFTYKDLAAFNGQRLIINNANGYFLSSIAAANTFNAKGSGNIHFNTLRLDSIGPNNYSGKMSGLFDADFTAFKITKGRFDHTLEPLQIKF
jgi:hypothetical protein